MNEIDDAHKEIDEINKTLFDLDSKATMFSTDIQISETKISEAKKQISNLDREIQTLQDELMRNFNDVSALESRKTELDERRKYIVETGDNEAKAKEMKQLVEAARLEFEDRKGRLDKLNAEIQLYSEQLNLAASNIIDKSTALDQAENRLRTLENRKNVLDSLIRNPFNNQQGIKSIMDNQNALQGILGVIGQVLKVQDGYEEAISTSLGGAMNNIVTKDEQCARDAIRFLTKNMSGRATFLPLNVCKPRYVRKEDLIVCENTEGYLGTASQFVENDPKFDPVVENLLNNVLIVDTMENGNHISALTNRQYKIVTLDGEVIHRGGSMTGGKNKHNTNIVTMKKEVEELDVRLDAERARVKIAKNEYESANTQRESASRNLQEKRYAAAALEPVVDSKKAKYEKLQNDLSLLQPEGIDEETSTQAHADDLVVRLNEAYSRRDTITNEIKVKRENRNSLNTDVERKEAQLSQMRKDLKSTETSVNEIKIDRSRQETRMETNLQRLASEYQLTYDFAKTKVSNEVVENAKEEVAKLRSEIEHLGNINMNAPEEYSEVNERYENLKKNIEELTLSRDKILSAIDEMDSIMKKQFKEMFDSINVAFDDIFRSLYGGGKARLILQDPNDLLNTGIDIDAQPPGKAVQNNMLFSGGEKSLIALCVLFAILKVKPVPLVILDEVEAALDPGNVERFASFLHNYTDRTQFLVVTHRVGTMEKADVLYGVTMQKQGVSQMLKVELKEAVHLADTGEQS